MLFVVRNIGHWKTWALAPHPLCSLVHHQRPPEPLPSSSAVVAEHFKHLTKTGFKGAIIQNCPLHLWAQHKCYRTVEHPLLTKIEDLFLSKKMKAVNETRKGNREQFVLNLMMITSIIVN